MENNKKYTELLWNGKYSEEWFKEFFELRKKATINIDRPNLAFQVVDISFVCNAHPSSRFFARK